MRLFIAINFDKETKEKLVLLQNKLKGISIKGNFSREENLHLTLVFLGEISPQRVELVKRQMDQISAPKFPIEFTDIGRFRREGGDIWWVGIQRNQELFTIQKKLLDALKAAGFKLDDRSFNPHITLAREVFLKDGGWAGFNGFSTQASSISLMKSERIGGKLTYTEIYSILLS